MCFDLLACHVEREDRRGDAVTLGDRPVGSLRRPGNTELPGVGADGVAGDHAVPGRAATRAIVTGVAAGTGQLDRVDRDRAVAGLRRRDRQGPALADGVCFWDFDDPAIPDAP